MRINKILTGTLLLISTSFMSCTNLDEHVYDQVMSGNYYQNREDVIRAVLRPFEHAYWSEVFKFECEETGADQLITPSRDFSHWYDAGRWERYHSHVWTIEEGPCRLSDPWDGWYRGIGQCNLVLEDLSRLDTEKLSMTPEELEYFRLQLRALRAWFHLYLFDGYRNIIIYKSAVVDDAKSLTQSPPKETFEWIEKECLECLDKLPAKTSTRGNAERQGQFNKAAVATMLVRLYLNAEKYIGVPRYQDCIAMAKRIRGGEFGNYSIEPTWDKVFDYTNETSNEVILAWPSSYGGTHWHYDSSWNTIYWRILPIRGQLNLGITGNSYTNPQYALSPSYDNDGRLFSYQLGMVTQKFTKYPGDYRYKQYKNLGGSKREGMFFLEGYLRDTKGKILQTNNYDIYLLDRVGQYKNGAATKTITGVSSESTLHNGEWNSGLYAVKYPMYPTGEVGSLESDYVEMRLPEVIYSEAESQLRLGNTEEAARLLNSVRKRNYPQSYRQQVLYAPEGNIQLDMNEMLDEWGREFLTEGRRRIDLVRFGRFQDAWWNKAKEEDSHTDIWPLIRKTLQSNLKLKQNPGYEDIQRTK